MSIWRRYTRRDGNEASLVAVAEAMGATWQPLSIRGGPDGMLGAGGHVALIEIKVGKGKLRETQQAWHAKWQGPAVQVVRNSSEMVAIVQQLRAEL